MPGPSATKSESSWSARPRWGVRGAASGLAVAIVLAATSGAATEPARPAVRLDFRRAPGAERCPSERRLRDEIAGQLGYDPVDDGAPRTLVATIFRGPEREVHATMELADGSGAATWTRHLVAYNDDCNELVLNMALSIRIALDPSLRGVSTPTTTPAPAPAVRPATPAPAPAPAPPAPAEMKVPRELRAGLGGGVSFGTLPLVTGGPSLDISLRDGLFSIGVEGRFDLPTAIDLGVAQKVSLWHAAATLAPCAQLRYLFGCGFVSLGAIGVIGTGVTVATKEPSLVAAAGPRAGVEVPISDRVAVRIHGDLAVRLTRTDLGSDNKRVWTSPPFAGIVGFRLVFILPAPRPIEPRGGASALVSRAR